MKNDNDIISGFDSKADSSVSSAPCTRGTVYAPSYPFWIDASRNRVSAHPVPTAAATARGDGISCARTSPGDDLPTEPAVAPSFCRLI